MAADLFAVHLALRNRALGVTVATTGAIELAATATGYTRAAGDFLADGFARGMEILPAGFPANPVDVIADVTAGTLTMAGSHAAAAEAAGRTITAGAPALRAFENVLLTPVSGRLYLEEDFVPATHVLESFPAPNADAIETGIYVLKWYGIPGTGILALRRSVDALKARFAPGTKLVAGAHTVRIRTNPAPSTGQILPLTSHAVLLLTIPWEVQSVNAIAP